MSVTVYIILSILKYCGQFKITVTGGRSKQAKVTRMSGQDYTNKGSRSTIELVTVICFIIILLHVTSVRCPLMQCRTSLEVCMNWV